MALVQAPQDYRDAAGDLFKRMCFWEYAGFFYLGMKSRDEKNAIIQHGTMALIRRSALVQAGGWAEWCITEDAELGLRLFEAGTSRGLYREELRPRPDARQLRSPIRKQRYRWAYGAMHDPEAALARAAALLGKSAAAGSSATSSWRAGCPGSPMGCSSPSSLLALAWTVGMILCAAT